MQVVASQKHPQKPPFWQVVPVLGAQVKHPVALNHHVNAIASRLSLRPPQKRSLEILDRITEIVPPRKGADIAAALAMIRTEFPAMHTSLARPPRSPDREKRSKNRRAALATRGVFFVRPKSERTSSLQFVATYLGRYSSNADEPGFTH